MHTYQLLFLLSVFISSISQVMLKTSADIPHKNKLFEYLNVRVITAYTFFFVSSFLTIIAYQGVALSTGALLEATGYIWVAVLGRIILKEHMDKKKYVGLGLIILGIVVSI